MAEYGSVVLGTIDYCLTSRCFEQYNELLDPNTDFPEELVELLEEAVGVTAKKTVHDKKTFEITFDGEDYFYVESTEDWIAFRIKVNDTGVLTILYNDDDTIDYLTAVTAIRDGESVDPIYLNLEQNTYHYYNITGLASNTFYFFAFLISDYDFVYSEENFIMWKLSTRIDPLSLSTLESLEESSQNTEYQYISSSTEEYIFSKYAFEISDDEIRGSIRERLISFWIFLGVMALILILVLVFCGAVIYRLGRKELDQKNKKEEGLTLKRHLSVDIGLGDYYFSSPDQKSFSFRDKFNPSI